MFEPIILRLKRRSSVEQHQLDWLLLPYYIKAIKSASSKQCATDPLPTWLLKDSIAVLASYITSLFNISLTNGYLPTQWKNAIVKPLIKKAGLDETLTSNYRPVSNLPFLSKVLERIGLRQLTNHLKST